MLDAATITQLHRKLVIRWHAQPVDNPEAGFLAIVCQQFGFNFLLWHEEDIARSPQVPDGKIAEVKRAIDRYNQQRNDGMEKLDDWLTAELARLEIVPIAQASQNTETVGSVIDRLSILALRIYHLEEQRDRAEATPQHRENSTSKLAIALAQHADLSQGLADLLADIYAGRKRHKTYRQLKLYNDPSMNPYLYQAQSPSRPAGGAKS